MNKEIKKILTPTETKGAREVPPATPGAREVPPETRGAREVVPEKAPPSNSEKSPKTEK